MTLIQMVQHECANWNRRTGCLFGNHECPVMEGKRCNVSKGVLLGGRADVPSAPDYFSTCVAPLAESKPEYADVVVEYSRNIGKRSPIVTVRPCECGQALASGDRLCAQCKTKRRRATYRAAQTKRRSCQQLRAKTDL